MDAALESLSRRLELLERLVSPTVLPASTSSLQPSGTATVVPPDASTAPAFGLTLLQRVERAVAAFTVLVGDGTADAAFSTARTLQRLEPQLRAAQTQRSEEQAAAGQQQSAQAATSAAYRGTATVMASPPRLVPRVAFLTDHAVQRISALQAAAAPLIAEADSVLSRLRRRRAAVAASTATDDEALMGLATLHDRTGGHDADSMASRSAARRENAARALRILEQLEGIQRDEAAFVAEVQAAVRQAQRRLDVLEHVRRMSAFKNPDITSAAAA